MGSRAESRVETCPDTRVGSAAENMRMVRMLLEMVRMSLDMVRMGVDIALHTVLTTIMSMNIALHTVLMNIMMINILVGVIMG